MTDVERDLKKVEELMEIIWGSKKPKRKGYITKPKKPRDSKGRYIKRR